MTKTYQKMMKNVMENQGYYDTKKYRYELFDFGNGYKLYRCERWKFGTTAMLEKDCWEEVK